LTVPDLKWLLGSLHQGDQFADRVNRQVAVHEQQRWRRCDQAERCKVLARVVTGIAENVRTGRQCRSVTENDRVAVGHRACDFARSHRAAAAGIAIFDNDPLPERVAHFVSDGAGHNVVGAAGRQRDNENNGAARIGVGGLAWRGGKKSSRHHNSSQRRYACQARFHFPSRTFSCRTGHRKPIVGTRRRHFCMILSNDLVRHSTENFEG